MIASLRTLLSIALLFVSGSLAQSCAPCNNQYHCPAEDNSSAMSRNSLGDYTLQSYSCCGNTLTCQYFNEDDEGSPFSCTYDESTGANTGGTDTPYCPATAISGPTSRKRSTKRARPAPPQAQGAARARKVVRKYKSEDVKRQT